MAVLPRSSRLFSLISLALLALAWGAIPLFVRADVPPTHLVAMRVTFGAVVLVAFSAATSRLSIPGKRFGAVIVLGVVLAAHWLSFFLALRLTTVAVTLALVYIGPVLAAVLSGPILGERLSRHAIAGLTISVAGMLLVTRPGSGATLEGVAVAAFSGVLLAVVMLVGKPLVSENGGVVIATWELVVASIVLSPYTVQAVRESAAYWPQFLILGGLFTGIAGVVYWTAMRRLPVAVVSVIMYLEPASAVVWAAVFLGERPDPTTWLGVALVVMAGMVATRDVGAAGEGVGLAEAV
jgi:drug/metabolite transporter (DMT)-like permease